MSLLQASTLAWPVTTGVPNIDYFMTFGAEIGTAQRHYSETLMRIPGILYYDEANVLAPPPAAAQTAPNHDLLRARFGLPPSVCAGLISTFTGGMCP